MGIDQDFPMTRTQLRVLVIGLVVMGVVGGVFFGGLVPGVKPNASQPAVAVLNGRSYYLTTATLAVPPLFQNSTAPQPFAFHNISFEFWVTGWFSVTAAQVHGNGTEPNGTVYAFVLGPMATAPNGSSLYLSPDGLFGVEWAGPAVAWNSVQVLVEE